ncbi:MULTISPECIES: hypothetical protein [unclassified Tenacibaculum]|uniref:hypothetical protein n=1 Tax=unclassified Tenacibaculum TaxID=2635139 RepID=UPI001F444B55|nr:MULTISPECIES: hypothetical protein [unclassified Tenacibaculum]MCF2874772.1 hypothetical protein [Tenacibaculum sp. Cn5-1]MCF2934162.1 hypothetical protein [Tenacibaculum sp. Cn5-34]MCG7510372.1 hypothetical protein [Tenacibaculum sp. Cn5-46]
MKILFENKRNKITFKTIIRNLFIKIPILILITSLFKSLLSWEKPEISEILLLFLIFNIIVLIQTLIHNYKNHLESITLDYEENKLILKYIKLSKNSTETVIKLNQIKVSEIKHMPISWFSFTNYFWVSDIKSKIKISTAGHGNKEIELDEIHKELSNIQHK